MSLDSQYRYRPATRLGVVVSNPDNTDATGTGEWTSFVSKMGTPSLLAVYADYSHLLTDWPGDAGYYAAAFGQSPWAGVTPYLSLPMALSAAAWTNHTFILDERCTNASNTYACITAGTSTVAPTGTSLNSNPGGTVHFKYLASIVNTPDYDFQQIVAGAWDTAINSVVTQYNAVSPGKMCVRPAWEMNINTTPAQITAANAAHFVSAWQHIYGLVKAIHKDIKVVWCPSEGDYNVPKLNMLTMYPGDAYVDVIGMDTYGQTTDLDTTPSDASLDASDYTLSYALAMASARGKPFGLGEVGGAATNATFPANMQAAMASNKVLIDHVVMWNNSLVASAGEWSVNATPSAAWLAFWNSVKTP